MKISIKNTHLCFAVLSSVLIVSISCTSTSAIKAEQDNNQTQEVEIQTSEKEKTPRELKVINSTTTVDQTKKDTPESIYEQKLQGIKISCDSYPKETQAQKPFTSPYVFKITDSNEKAVSDFELSILYPESKEMGQEVLQITDLKSDSNGIITFIPPTPSFAFDSLVKAYPSGDVTNSKIAELAEKHSISVPYKVKTNKQYSGGNIAIVDFTTSGKPITNNSVSSSNILMSLMKAGFKRIGNIDLTNEILSDDISLIHKNAKALLGNNSKYLIYGTVKYDSPISKNEENLYTVTLNAKVNCLDLTNGELLSTFEFSKSSAENSEWKCLDSARKEIADFASQKILYGL